MKVFKRDKIFLPVQVASVSAIASKMSAEGFSNPSWIILVLSLWELLHQKCIEIITLNRDKNMELMRKGAHLRKLAIKRALDEIFYIK